MNQIEVNYKNKKRYNTARYPIRQPFFLTILIWILSKFALIGKKHKIEKINMLGLKPPYILLSNHMYFIDFELTAVGTFPHRMNNVVNIDGYIHRAWLLRLIGSICTRKFSNDFHLIKSIKKVLKRGDILGMYPEARYSACGITSYIPPSVAKLVKSCKVPLVVVIHRGNHLHTPFWAWQKKRKVPLHTTIKQVLTKEEIETMTSDEIYEVIKKEFVYDDYKYQKDNNILITEKDRAEKLNKILYKCPHCHEEGSMKSYGTHIYCTKCNKSWKLCEDGSLKATTGETEFEHLPDWYKWEKATVKDEVVSGTYYFEDEVNVYSLPRTNGAIHLGKAKVTHSIDNGFVLEGYYNDAPYRIIRKPLQANSLHIEYDYVHILRKDCFVINTEDDSYFCFPTKKDVITKIGFATEEIYQLHSNNKRSQG